MPSGGTPGNINVICTTLKSKLVGYNSIADNTEYGSVFVRLTIVRRCCLPNLRNHVKFQENFNLNQFEVIDLDASRKSICNFLLIISSDFGLSRTVLEILTHKARIARFHHPQSPCLRSGESARISGWNLRCKNWRYGATVWWKLHNLHQTFLIDPPVWQMDGRTNGRAIA